MKLPFNYILGPIIKPYLTRTKLFCAHPTFSFRTPYTYIYGTLGLCVSVHHLKKHFGEIPLENGEENLCPSRNNMILHDLRIIATSMGLIQYSCLLIGCLTAILTSTIYNFDRPNLEIFYEFILKLLKQNELTYTDENPALFLPHLTGQMLIVSVKILNVLLFLCQINLKSLNTFRRKISAIMLLIFNCLQEFCVFRQYLCVCDL